MPRSKQFQEDVVLEKAMNLFWGKGYHATSIQDLVTHLQINRASMYQTFGGKEDLFNRSLERYLQSNSAQIKLHLEAGSTVLDGFDRLFRAIATQLATDPLKRGCFIVNSAMELLPDNERASEMMRRIKACEIALYEEYIRKGMSQNEIDPNRDAQELATYLHTIHGGLTVVAKVDPSLPSLLAVVANAMRVLKVGTAGGPT